MQTMMAMKIRGDRMFLQKMIPHHQGDVEMSTLAMTQSERPVLKMLARTIVREQSTEIAHYKALLRGVR